MFEYAQKSWLYVSAVVVVTVAVLYFRSEGYKEGRDWSRATASNDSRTYREFCTNWRVGPNAKVAYAKWAKALQDEYERLDWLSPYAVRDFIKYHPEFRAEEILAHHFRSVLNDGTYESLKKYFDFASDDDPHKGEVRALINAMIMKEVKPAVKSDDYQALKRLSERYSSWNDRDVQIDDYIPKARENAARKEWALMDSCRSETELRKFMSKFSGTEAEAKAKRRIDALYDDFDFVRSQGTLRAYYEFARKHPDSPRVNEAVVGELERYVFKRKVLNASDETFVKKVLAQYQQNRPSSGLLYGGNYGSPFQINTPTYSLDDYFIKLVNISSGNSVGIYVRGGTSTEVNVPDGTYSVRYVTGKKWHGTRLLFGFDAHYSKANQTFTFRNGQGYSLSLQKVAHGNLHTSSMSAQDF